MRVLNKKKKKDGSLLQCGGTDVLFPLAVSRLHSTRAPKKFPSHVRSRSHNRTVTPPYCIRDIWVCDKAIDIGRQWRWVSGIPQLLTLSDTVGDLL